MLKILHAADFHLDSPFSSLPPDRASVMKREQNELIYALCDKANDLEVDMVLLAGDLFDGENAFYDTALLLKEALAGIRAPVFIAPGNHDPIVSGSPYLSVRWSDNVHIFRSPEITRAEAAGIAVYGAGFTGRREERALLAGFHTDERAVMVLHGDRAQSSFYNPVSDADIADSGLLYLALGHVHQASGLQKAGETYWSYPGALSGRGFDECGEKGAVLITLEDGKAPQHRFIPLGKRQYKMLACELPAGISASEALASLTDTLGDAVAADIVRLTVTGALPAELTEQAVMTALADKAFSLSVRLRPSVMEDMWQLAEEDTLAGLAMARMRQKYADARDEEEKRTAELAARYIHAAAKNIRTDGEGGFFR